MNTPNEIVLVDQDIDRTKPFGMISINEETINLLNIVKKPLILEICYFQTEVKITYELDSYRASLNGPTELVSVQYYSSIIDHIRML
jgi:hypothetical protein